MDPFLDLSKPLTLSDFDLRQLIEGRARILDRIEALSQDSAGERRDLAALSDADGTEFDGLTARAEELADAIEERQQQQRGEQRMQRLTELRTAPTGTATPARGGTRAPAPQSRTSGRQSRDRLDPVEHPDAHNYSLMRAIERRLQNLPLDGIEAEVSQEIARRSGEQPKGFYVPHSLVVDRRAIEQRAALSTSTGAGAIPTIQAGTLIEALRAQSVLVGLGAQVMNDMVGVFEIPKETNTGSYYHVTEDSAVGEDSPTIGEVQFTPKTIGAYIDLTRRFLKQGSIDAELYARRRLAKNLGLGIDYAGINGDPGSNVPEGILQDGDITVVAIGTNGGAMTWDKIVALESAVATQNALAGNLAYLTSAGGRGHLKTQEKSSGTAVYLWEEDQLNGYRASVSTQVPTNLTKGTGTNLTPVIFGDFSQLMFAFWGGLDVLIDPFTSSTKGKVRVVAMQDYDLQRTHDQAFAICVDMDPNA